MIFLDGQVCGPGTITRTRADCVDGWWKVGSFCYHVVHDQNADFDKARQGCIDRRSRLAWVQTRPEMCTIGNLIETEFGGNARDIRLGGVQVGTSNNFIWVESDNTAGKWSPYASAIIGFKLFLYTVRSACELILQDVSG